MKSSPGRWLGRKEVLQPGDVQLLHNEMNLVRVIEEPWNQAREKLQTFLRIVTPGVGELITAGKLTQRVAQCISICNCCFCDSLS
jgi:hypothetical protein